MSSAMSLVRACPGCSGWSRLCDHARQVSRSRQSTVGRYVAETGRRHPCHGAVADSFGPFDTVIPRLQYIDQVFDVLVAQFQQSRAKSWETVEIPQLQLEFSWTSCCSPVVCNNKYPWSMTRCSSSTVVNVPVIMRDSGNAPYSGHREFGGHSSSQQRQVLDFQQWQQ